MKRSRKVILPSMKKDWRQADVRPLVAFMGLATVTGCSDDSTEAEIFRTVEECSDAHPGYTQQCQAAYQDAAELALLSSPRFNSQDDCEFDFTRGCFQPEYQNWFIPALSGFMFARLTDSHYYSRPMYIYRSGWYSDDGIWYGSSSSSYKKHKKIKVKTNDFKKPPAVSKTMSRGGFGSTVEAKSSWSKSSGSKSSSRSSGKKSGWGG